MASVFQDVEMAPPIEVFQLSKLYTADGDENKVNLGVGAYRTDEGKPWVLPVVSEAEKQMAADVTLNHEYLPVAGMPDFRVAATKLLLGASHPAITANRTESFQCLGGTGALRLAAAFLHNVLKFDVVYVSNPTWGNHKGIFKGAGFKEVRDYRYWDAANLALDFNGMIEDLNNAPENAVVILHAVAHNPTGVDPTKEQWNTICQTCIDKKLFVVMDNAYQGFATGDLDEDGFAARMFAERDMDLFIAQSFSKNFGLYNERTGNLVVVTKDPKKLPEIRSQAEIQIRVIWSNPPNHGARIVATVLNNKAFYDQWRDNVVTMSSRIKKMRQELQDQLKNLSTPGSWSHITSQIGMFSYTGLNAKQVEMMKNDFHVYLLGSGRISMAGVTSKNVAHVAKAMDAAVRAYPNLKLAPRAGEEGFVPETIDFVEYARRKLKNIRHNVIQTRVTLTGDLVFETEEDNPTFELTDETSEASFYKVRMDIKSVSSLDLDQEKPNNPKAKTSQQEPRISLSLSNRSSSLKAKGSLVQNSIGRGEAAAGSEGDVAKSVDSRESQQGSERTEWKSKNSFKNRKTQTVEVAEEACPPLSLPAVFEGTMTTPIYFNGVFFTPADLDKLLHAATDSKTGVPVTFQGTTDLDKNHGDHMMDSQVKLKGQLAGVMNNGTELPVTFDGVFSNQYIIE